MRSPRGSGWRTTRVHRCRARLRRPTSRASRPLPKAPTTQRASRARRRRWHPRCWIFSPRPVRGLDWTGACRRRLVGRRHPCPEKESDSGSNGGGGRGGVRGRRKQAAVPSLHPPHRGRPQVCTDVRCRRGTRLSAPALPAAHGEGGPLRRGGVRGDARRSGAGAAGRSGAGGHTVAVHHLPRLRRRTVAVPAAAGADTHVHGHGLDAADGAVATPAGLGVAAATFPATPRLRRRQGCRRGRSQQREGARTWVDGRRRRRLRRPWPGGGGGRDAAAARDAEGRGDAAARRGRSSGGRSAAAPPPPPHRGRRRSVVVGVEAIAVCAVDVDDERDGRVRGRRVVRHRDADRVRRTPFWRRRQRRRRCCRTWLACSWRRRRRRCARGGHLVSAGRHVVERG
eukprot:Rhum_TRINITY_DN14598_c24_g1::Rhum_TRINITY_DN14598_c24_g1_i1::g.100942::m.100942